MIHLFEKALYGDILVHIPMFDGNLKSDAFIDWLNEIEKNFNYKNIVSPKCVKFAAAKLHGYALVKPTSVSE